MLRKVTVVSISLALLFGMVGIAEAMVQNASDAISAAATGTVLPCPTGAPDTPTATALARSNLMAGQIAARYCIGVAQIEAWHDQGLGYGEIGKAYELAAASGLPVEELIARHQAGEGWGNMAHSLGFQLMGGGFNARVRALSTGTPAAEAVDSGEQSARGGRQDSRPDATKPPHGQGWENHGQGNGNGNGNGNGGNGHGGGHGNGNGGGNGNGHHGP